MIEDSKKNIAFLIITISLIIILLLSLGIFCLVRRHVKEDDIYVDVVNNVSLDYIPLNDIDVKVRVKLTEKEQNELYKLVKKLEFGTPTVKCEVIPRYYLEYDNDKLYLDDSCGLAVYNQKTYGVTKGREDIKDFLDKKIKSLNNVYLFNYNQKSEETTNLEISEEAKNKIRNIWSKHSKEVAKIDMEFTTNYYLLIDEEIIEIESLDNYVLYNGGYLMLEDDLYNLLAPYFEIDILHFSLDGYSEKIKMYGSMFNMYKGEEIKTRDDAINNASKLWEEHLDFKENDFKLKYDVYYDRTKDCYLVYARPKANNILDGCATIIMKSTGEVVAMWG